MNQIVNKSVKSNWKEDVTCENTYLHENSSFPLLTFAGKMVQHWDFKTVLIF